MGEEGPNQRHIRGERCGVSKGYICTFVLRMYICNEVEKVRDRKIDNEETNIFLAITRSALFTHTERGREVFLGRDLTAEQHPSYL